MRRYRFATLFAAKVGPWRNTRREALEDAVEADMAEFDDAAHGGVQLDAGVLIDECEAGEEPKPLSDWELWACAAAMLKEHGAEAPQIIAERLGNLALKADIAGMQAWRAIAHRVDQLMRGTAQGS